ncbi:hypothetical protein NMG60_11008531 [Bertholletia excelsa]
MAEATKFKDVQEALKHNDNLLKEFIESTDLKFQEVILDINQKFSKLERLLESLIRSQYDKGRIKLTRRSPATRRHCNKLFPLFPMDEHSKVTFAGHFMKGRADLWFLEYIEGKMGINWDRFCEMLVERFILAGGEYVLIEFSNLTQESDVSSYQERFEELKSFVKIKYPSLGEKFFISKFLGGLNLELRLEVQKFHPKSLPEVVNIARLEEYKIQIAGFSNKSQKLNFINKGLCYHCDEKYSFSHNYKNKQFNLIVAKSKIEENEREERGIEAEITEQEDEEGITIHAIIGNRAKTTLKIMGMVKKRKLSILIDSGSTHSFLDTDTARELNWADWMWSYSPVTFDYKQGWVSIHNEGRKITLKGVDDHIEVEMLGGKGLKKFFRKASHGILAHLFAINAEEEQQQSPSSIARLLLKFEIVAYRLKLPTTTRMHPVFHVSLLKKQIKAKYFANVNLPTVDDQGCLQVYPFAILSRRILSHKKKPLTQVLVHWSNSLPEEATWENWNTFQ